jgi:hypothetical protein
MTEPVFDHEKLDVYRLSIEYAAASYGIAKALTAANRQLRDQFAALDKDADGHGKSQLKRIVPMLTRSIQRSDSVIVEPT